MKKTIKFASSIALAVLFLTGGFFTRIVDSQKVSEIKADAEYVAYFNPVNTYNDNSVGGYVKGNYRYLCNDDGGNGTILENGANLGLYTTSDGSTKDDNVTLHFDDYEGDGYAIGNFVRIDEGKKILSLRYGSNSSNGSSLTISPNDLSKHLIKNVKFVFSTYNFDSNTKKSTFKIEETKLDNSVVSNSYLGSNIQTSGDDAYTFTYSSSSVDNFRSLKITNLRGSTHGYLYIAQIVVTYADSTLLAVSFDSDGGTEVETQYLTSGSLATRPADPTKSAVGTTAYTFVGWYLSGSETKFDFENTPITSSLTLHAHWEEHEASTFTISFESNGGTEIPDLVVASGEVATKPTDPTRSTSNDNKYQFTFGGWYVDSTLKTAYDWSSTVGEDLILYAKWSFSTRSAPSGRVHYSPNAKVATWGADYNDDGYKYQESVTLSSITDFQEPTKEGITYKISRNDSSHGLAVHKKQAVVRSAKIEITIDDSSKVFTYARQELGDWGENSVHFYMYANDDLTNAIDTEAGPNTTEKIHYVHGTFAPSEKITKITIITENFIHSLKDVYLKFDTNPDYGKAVEYATNFNDAHVCGTLDTDGFDSGKWEEQKEAYLDLSEGAKAYFQNYEGTNEEIIECLERYDRVIYLYGEDYDFMGRIESDHIQVKSLSNLNLFEDNDGTIATIMVVSVLAACSLATLVMFKRRKHS